MFGTYKEKDVVVLLKNITGQINAQSTEEREKVIQHGGHYSEMLPIEYQPSSAYIQAYNFALQNHSQKTAFAVGIVSDKIYNKIGKEIVLVSLARAGTPIGILIKHYLERKYNVKVYHYTISIIRGRGIDKNAMNFILNRHDVNSVQFVDGWTGKGAIKTQLLQALADFPGVSKELAVLADPANITDLCGTHEDFPIASSFLNSTVSGLLSRTVLRKDLIFENDFHGAVFYENLKEEDKTYEFIDKIESLFDFNKNISDEKENTTSSGLEETIQIAKEFGVDDINLVKPGIGEATRVLLRRSPWKILVYSLNDNYNLGHIYALAKEKNIPLVEYPLSNYRACGIIKKVVDA